MATTAPLTAPKLTRSFTPPPAKFRGFVSPDPAAAFPAEKDRYALYLHLGCPWAHRTNIVYQLKQLQSIIALSVVSMHRDASNSWAYDGTGNSDGIDPVESFKNFKQLYERADPQYVGSYSVPLLWDRKKKTIVSNDSVSIMRMMFTAFDEFLQPGLREVNKPGGGLRPEKLALEIEELGCRIEGDFNWGTYKCGMAASQEDYDESMKRLFGLLGELEETLSGKRYLFGNHITETDIRLFTTAVRFDMAYYTVFMCNWKMIRYDYPHLHRWLREIYYEVHDETKGAFQSTTHFELYMEGYAISAKRMTLVPWGPAVPIMPLDA